MTKKLSLILGAVALLALAIPALANADSITSSKGVRASVKSTIVATSTNFKVTNTPVGTVTCKHVQVSGIITINTATDFAVSDDTTGTTKECDTPEPATVTLKNLTLIELVGGAAANTTFMGLGFTVVVGPITCEYKNDSATSIPFTYVAGTDTIHIDGTLIDPNRVPCGTPTVEGDFTLTIGGTPVILD